MLRLSTLDVEIAFSQACHSRLQSRRCRGGLLPGTWPWILSVLHWSQAGSMYTSWHTSLRRVADQITYLIVPDRWKAAFGAGTVHALLRRWNHRHFWQVVYLVSSHLVVPGHHARLLSAMQRTCSESGRTVSQVDEPFSLASMH